MPVTGFKETMENLLRVQVEIHAALQEEAYADANEYIFKRSQELVPIDTEALLKSGRIEWEETAEGIQIIVSYGNPEDETGDYAIVQHEDMTLKHTDGRSSKYLEIPATEAASGMLERIGVLIGSRIS